jgi:hypothetical protein
MAKPKPGQRLEDVSKTPQDRNRLVFPVVHQPLRPWTAEEIGEEVMLESMELLTQVARSAPDFEANRLRGKNAQRFRF